MKRRFLAALGAALVLAMVLAAGSLPALADKGGDGEDGAWTSSATATGGSTSSETTGGLTLTDAFQQAAAGALSPAQLVDLFKQLATQAGADRRGFAQALRQFMHGHHGLSGVALQAAQQMASRGDGGDAEQVLEATLEEDGQSVSGSVYGDQTVSGTTYAADNSVTGATYASGGTVSGSVYEKEKEMEDAFAALGRLYAQRGERALHVFVNGAQPSFDVQPVVVHGRALVPVRAVVEALKAQVTWDGQNNTVTVQANGHTVVFTIGSTTAVVDGQSVTLDVAPVIRGDRTLLPLRYLAEYLGIPVHWQAQGNIAIVGLGAGGSTTATSTSSGSSGTSGSTSTGGGTTGGSQP